MQVNYRITIRAAKLWNITLSIQEKLIEKFAIFKVTIKTRVNVAGERQRIFLIHV